MISIIPGLIDHFENQQDFRLISDITKVIACDERKIWIDGYEIQLYEPVGITFAAFELMGEKTKTSVSDNKIALLYDTGFVIGTSRRLLGSPDLERGYWVLDVYGGKIVCIKKSCNGTCIYTGLFDAVGVERQLRGQVECL